MHSQAEKFSDPYMTAKGERRAWVDMTELKTLWFNTGTLCNLSCANCYIESSPRNDRLAYLTLGEVAVCLDEIARERFLTEEIGITGGEPFMNLDIIPIMEECLKRGFSLLVLTNAMRPMMKHEGALLRLKDLYGGKLTLRVSVDHFERHLHEEERGPRTWGPTIEGLKWLSNNGFDIAVAGRTRWGENEETLRNGYAALFKENDINIDASDSKQLILFPEMDENAPVPEITTSCWATLGVNPDDMMCASSRMVVKHKGDENPSVMACTLLAYDARFNMGRTLKEASRAVSLNHPHCAEFCVLGGGSCTAHA
ncbi:MAG: radical SAM protein [Thiobacillus sp.]|nr:radical SAM protein [Thiobacillus sp.]